VNLAGCAAAGVCRGSLQDFKQYGLRIAACILCCCGKHAAWHVHLDQCTREQLFNMSSAVAAALAACRHGDDWDEVARAVPTKTKKEVGCPASSSEHTQFNMLLAYGIA
jgi:hypothetical protein